jgi:chromatin segregation and condensation protein Rec8/ScpA/Scc1 (kleisin family)
VLELIKQYAIDVRQEVPFGDIVIFSKGKDGARGIPANPDIPQTS